MVNFWKGTNYLNSANKSVSVTDAETGCNAFVYYAQQLSQAGDESLLYLVDTVGGSGGASGCVANTTTATTAGTCTIGATSTGATTSPDTGAVQASLPLSNNGWIKPTWQTGVCRHSQRRRARHPRRQLLRLRRIPLQQRIPHLRLRRHRGFAMRLLLQ